MGKRKSSMRERTRQQAEDRASFGGGSTSIKLPDGVEFFSPEKGIMKLDFLPYEVTDERHPGNVAVGDEWFERPFKAHRDVGIDQVKIICPTSIGKPCPICEHMQQLKRSGDADDDLIKALRPKDRCLYNVREHDDDEIKVWDVSYYLFTEQLDEEIRNAEEEDDAAGFAELEDGSTLKIRFKEKTFGKTKYCETGRIDFVGRDDIDEEILDEVVNLDKVLIIMNYDEIERLYYEMDDEDGDGDGDKAEKKSSRRASSKKKDEEEKKSSRRGKSSKKKDENEGKEEKVKPSRRRKSSKKKDEDEGKEETAAERKKRKKAERAAKKKEKEKEDEGDGGDCPFGHDFGDQCDETDDCEKCDNWDACFDKSEE